MPSNSIFRPHAPSSSFTLANANAKHENNQPEHEKIAGQLLQASNVTESIIILDPAFASELKNRTTAFINKITDCQPAHFLKEPDIATTILGQFSTTSTIPNRFRPIEGLSHAEKTDYKQVSNAEQTNILRCNLLSLIDEDLQEAFKSILSEWEMFGLSACEIDLQTYGDFKTLYDEVMEEHAIIKEDYSKVDFSAQNIKSKITDIRCLNAKMTPLQIFKAAYQLGDIPAVANFRFMDNPASKDDGKYREWMFHFDNSNYAAEFKLITTRITDTLKANQEQCLAAFPYNTSQFIRFTGTEAATKFPTMEILENEISHVSDARYVVIKNPHNNTPIETGIRTEMIAHHRSASNKEGLDQGEHRSAELMTFHGIGRCQPFLSSQELDHASTLTPLQTFVLGGFKNSDPEKFIEYMTLEKQAVNNQLHELIKANRIKSIESITVAKFSPAGTVVVNEAVFKKQMDTYDNLPEVIEQIPRLTGGSDDLKKTVFQMVPMLMNFDQNAELKPDCSENRAFPARTQIRERTNEGFCAPLRRDLEQVQFNIHPSYLLRMDEIIDIAKNIHELYGDHSAILKERPHDKQLLQLFESRAELAKEYTTQLPSRASLPETHQTLSLFIYYMIDDLDKAAQSLLANNIKMNADQMNRVKDAQCKILQHFVTHRLLNDSIPR